MHEVSIFGKYDVRGKYPTQLNARVVADIARAFVVFLKKPKTLVVGRDARSSGAELASSFVTATRERGVDVVDVGVVPVEVFYFAIRFLKADGGVFVSASHNAGNWNGLNFAGPGACGISGETGLKLIERNFLQLQKKPLSPVAKQGSYRVVSVQQPYFRFLKKLISSLKLSHARMKLHIGISGSGGVSAAWFEEFLRFAGFSFVRTTRVSSSSAQPNPLLASARRDLVQTVQKNDCDFGVAWDMDGDRAFFVDETGTFVHPTVVAQMVADALLRVHPKAPIVSDSRYVLGLRDTVRAAGGKLFLSHPGMTVVSRFMEQKKAIFGAEASGHYYFADMFYRDSGFLPVFYMLFLLVGSGASFKTLAAPFVSKFFVSDEVNIRLPREADVAKIFSGLLHKYRDGVVSRFEGVAVSYPQWRFALRASATEPVIRLTAEGVSRALVRKEVARLRHAISLLV